MKGGVAPCMEEGMVKRKLPESPSQLLGIIFIHLTPVAGRADRERREEVSVQLGGEHYLRPEGRGCKAPPTYRNLFWAAG